MTVKEYLFKKMSEGTIHMTLIDPDKQPAELAAEIARTAEGMGSDAIMIGGSTDVTQENLDATAKAIKAVVDIPVIYFPSGAHALSRHCDALYFMSMMNSRNLRMVMGEQVTASQIVKMLGIEPVSMGYIIVEPGMKVGEVGQAEVIKRDDVKTAVSYALAAEYLGMSMVYLEAGSGAPQPVPPAMVATVKSQISIPLLVGGGIRDPQTALAAKEAGANAIITGTLVEGQDYSTRLGEVIAAIKG
ncbi:MAG: geranylgeranylglyceryl/heptaprenylglyceryl phosphate synthase [Candidatus Methanomethylophilaceae archaeon]|nr:geranylgeranylglyceryl/heptaprenylglyceryl phosphate synthase [Candidatus Methanomethylophilaceae archaeon]